ncbi:hypothetical protein ACHAPE_008643 [Trichoderma viride]
MNSDQANTPEEGRKLRSGTVVNTANTSEVCAPIVAENRPACLDGTPGNLRYVPGDDRENFVGVVSLAVVGLGMLCASVDDPDGATEGDRRAWREYVDFVTSRIDDFEAGFRAGVHAVVEEEVLAGLRAALRDAARGKRSGIAATPKENSQ